MPKKKIEPKTMIAPSARRFLSPQAAADTLCCSPRTLIRWETDFEPPWIRSYRLPNGERRYLESDVFALLRAEAPVPTREQRAQAALARAALKKKRIRQLAMKPSI